MPYALNKPIKILAIDDAEDFRRMYVSILTKNKQLKEKFTVETASTAKEAQKIMEDFNPDLIILDVNLPDISGFDLCKEIRKTHESLPYVGIIFVTAHSTPQLIADGLKLGADDFCSKDHTATELIARIQAVNRIKMMTDSLKATNEKLRAANQRLARITITDELSKLYNMRYFKRRLYQEFIRAKRYEKDLSIIMFDLDYFKLVNDKCDHLMGSFVLSEIGHLVAKSIRSVDIAARFGGDEYIIMLPETNSEGAHIMAERIRKAISETEFDNSIFKVKITASLGVITLGEKTRHIPNATELLRMADRLLYEAKNSGRNRVVCG